MIGVIASRNLGHDATENLVHLILVSRNDVANESVRAHDGDGGIITTGFNGENCLEIHSETCLPGRKRRRYVDSNLDVPKAGFDPIFSTFSAELEPISFLLPLDISRSPLRRKPEHPPRGPFPESSSLFCT